MTRREISDVTSSVVAVARGGRDSEKTPELFSLADIERFRAEMFAFKDTGFALAQELLGALLESKNKISIPYAMARLMQIKASLAADSVLSKSMYNRLRADPEIVHYIEHDTRIFAYKLFLATDTLLDLFPIERVDQNFFKQLRFALIGITRAWPTYAFSLDDVLSRKLEKNGKIPRRMALDTALLGQALNDITHISDPTRQGLPPRVEQLFGDRVYSFPQLENDEEIRLAPGQVGNTIFNIISNASKEAVGATRGQLTLEREDDYIVVRIMDNGIGMPPEQAGTIFAEGKSFTGSTGYGLANLDNRLKSSGVILRLATVPRKRLDRLTTHEPDLDYTYFANDSQYQGRDNLYHIIVDQAFSTIFELRLPITKKLGTP